MVMGGLAVGVCRRSGVSVAFRMPEWRPAGQPRSERQGPMRRRRLPWTWIVLPVAAALAVAPPAGAATPPSGTLTGSDQGQGELKYTGATGAGTEAGSQDQGAGCFGVDGKPSPT